MGNTNQSRVQKALGVFAKSIIQPLMYLSVAGIMLIVGIVLTSSNVTSALPILQSYPFQLVGEIIYDSLMFLINNLAIIFCAGIAGAMAKKNKGHATLIGLMAFFLFLEANNITLSLNGQLVDASENMLGLIGTGQTEVLGIQVIDTGVFGGIVLGCIAGTLFNRFSDKQFPAVLSMFSGVRFPFLIIAVISWIMGWGFCYIWPPVASLISALAEFIQGSGNVGLFVYGILNKLLVPLGLHHLIYAPLQFSDMGGTLVLGDIVVTGAYPIRATELAIEGMAFSESTYYNSYTFNNLWPYIGIGLAFIATSYPKNRKKTQAVMVPLIITVVLSCITEPMDFLFVFAAPALFVIHSILSGIFLVLLKVLSIPASTSGGIIPILVSNLVLGVEKTNWPMMFVLGIINAVVYFFLFSFLIKKFDLHTPGRQDDASEGVVEAEVVSGVIATDSSSSNSVDDGTEQAVLDLIAGLGGKGNIESLENCFTRLRIIVKDSSLINEELINHVPNSGIHRNDTDIQVIYGLQVASMRNKIEDALERL